jgi:hypothetical protein
MTGAFCKRRYISINKIPSYVVCFVISADDGYVDSPKHDDVQNNRVLHYWVTFCIFRILYLIIGYLLSRL